MEAFGTKYGIPVTASSKDDTVTVKSAYSHAGTATKLTDGDLIKLCIIPANHVVTGLEIFSADLDSGAGLVFDAGLMDVTGDVALETVFVSGSTLGQAGGVLGNPATTTMYLSEAAAVDKVLAIEVTTSAVGAGATGSIGCVVQYQAV